MIAHIDALLNRITMYRLALYVLAGLVAVAAILASFGSLPFSPGSLLVSVGLLVGLCWASNIILAHIFDVPTNVESAFITALILALIFDPAQSSGGFQLLGWAAILAMASKYLLSIGNKHLFNPAAVAAVIVSFALRASASWWVGTASMLPFVLVGGLLVVRKLRQEEMVGAFIAAALVTVCAVSVVQGLAIGSELRLLLVESPLFFFGTIMLTEPLTSPPTRDLKRVYGILMGVLVVPQIHIGSLYSTPELALVAGNCFSYLVSPRQRVALTLKKRTKLAPGIVELSFAPTQRVAFAPGQYMEFTLAHPSPDSRGNRRYFTIASSPTEDALRLGVRFYNPGSSFKRALAAIDGRTRMIAGQVAGDFTLPNDPSRKLAFIAGGIGITPYRSMLKYLLDTGQRRDVVLLYANRSADEIIYRDVLGDAEARLDAKVVYTLTDSKAVSRNWTGRVGRIDEPMIRESVPDYAERTFYLSGPTAMVRAHHRALRALGVPRAHIKTDLFAGLV